MTVSAYPEARELLAAVPGAYEVRIARGAHGIERIRDDWDDLFERASHAPAHMSRAWCGRFAQAHGARAVAFSVWRGGMMAALLPLRVRQLGPLRIATPLATGLPSYLGVVSDPREIGSIAALAQRCLAERAFDAAIFEDVADNDEPTNLLLDELARAGASIHRWPRNVCRWARLGGSFEDYLQEHKSAKSRQTLRRLNRRLNDAHSVELERYVGASVSDQIVQRLAAIQHESWMKERGAAVLGQPFHHELVRSLAADGLARVWIMTIDGEDAAFVCGLAAHRTLVAQWASFKIKFKELSIGRLLIGNMLEDCCRAGITACDFGHSDSEYKEFWGTGMHQVWRVVVGRGALGHAAAWSYAKSWALYRRLNLQPYVRALRRRVRRAAGQ